MCQLMNGFDEILCSYYWCKEERCGYAVEHWHTTGLCVSFLSRQSRLMIYSLGFLCMSTTGLRSTLERVCVVSECGSSSRLGVRA